MWTELHRLHLQSFPNTRGTVFGKRLSQDLSFLEKMAGPRNKKETI